MSNEPTDRPPLERFFSACEAGDISGLRQLLRDDPALVGERIGGTTGLHGAVQHPAAVAVLLEHGADPNARDVDDFALPLHFAAGGGPLEVVRALLDAGSDVHGAGDLHRLDVIGWATVFAVARMDVVDLLVERGARHHVFSAIAIGDLAELQRVVEREPNALRRRLSRFEQEQTALHYVIAPPDGLAGGAFRTGAHYASLARLIAMGAELEAVDANGRTPLVLAMLRGDREAMRLLSAAGAAVPSTTAGPRDATTAGLAPSIGMVTPMLSVPDVDDTVAWYQSVGFELTGSHENDGRMDWASVTLGDASIMFVPSRDGRRQDSWGVSLWIRTARIDPLYAALRQRQLRGATAVLLGDANPEPDVQFTQDLHTAFYGQREFGVRDVNGVELFFFEPIE